MPRPPVLAAIVCLCSILGLGPTLRGADHFAAQVAPLLKRFCIDCHGPTAAEANLNLERLSGTPAFATSFKDWQRVAAALEAGKMPPRDAAQPTPEERRAVVRQIRVELANAARQHASDPGPVVLRRLTSAEYAYTLQDLTGLDLDVDRDFVGDAVGGEGFTNVGQVQFVQDADLERYLGAAKRVAAHATIGAGPLAFYPDPGQTGLELSAVHRIQDIYRQHGFRTAAGEGGQAYGLDRYPRAFYVAWQFRHRAALRLDLASLESLAAAEKIDVRFAKYVHSILTDDSPAFPTSEIVSRWNELPAPSNSDPALLQRVRACCDEIYDVLHTWQSRLAGNVIKKEEAAVLSERVVEPKRTHAFEAEIDWPAGSTTAEVIVSVNTADIRPATGTLVVWKNSRIRFRGPDRKRDEPTPLAESLSSESSQKLNWGQHPAGRNIGQRAFVIAGAAARTLTLRVPPGASRAELFAEVELDRQHGADGVVRCAISEDESASQGKAVSAILADPDGQAVATWRTGVMEFARLFPQISHREPAPSDRDPIPAPFDNTYNVPERDHFHYKVKYFRDDRFLTEQILDDDARRRLDQAWADLLGSFEYHDVYLRFVAEKYRLDLGGRRIGELDAAWLGALAPEARQHVERLVDEHRRVRLALATSESGHVTDVLRLAERAWRRPLAEPEQQRLSGFYRELRTQSKLSHADAVRALLARVLTAPEFLYRAEAVADRVSQLSREEIATRLSYFLWSSLPDDELRQAATVGNLHDPQSLVMTARRMLRDPKAQRLAAEFFGQWLGFYQFDRYRGVDAERFPEFTDALRSDLHQEAIAFFTHLIREDRPVSELLHSDYTFLNAALAQHYGVAAEVEGDALTRVAGLKAQHRGGLLGLGAVLTATSAPLRTSPVKRGDWILRRLLGTPVPPPPADAGSIAADDVSTDRLTIRDRLEAHRRNPSCMNCHSRIDPLGFALEQYDAIGRWRTEYRDGEKIIASAPLADGTPLDGPEGLRRYLQQEQESFHRTLCTRLLGYALGRTESIADQELIGRMVAACRRGEGRLSDLVAEIVVSPQFTSHRGRAAVAATGE